MLNVHRILLPVDFSPGSKLALTWAMTIAKGQKRPTIVLLHILPYIPSLGMDTKKDSEMDTARKKLKAWRRRIPKNIASEIVCERIVLGGAAIARICRDRAIDLVVMTTRGRRGLPRLIEGSLSEETVRLASCPVFVLHLNA